MEKQEQGKGRYWLAILGEQLETLSDADIAGKLLFFRMIAKIDADVAELQAFFRPGKRLPQADEAKADLIVAQALLRGELAKRSAAKGRGAP